MKFGLDQIGKDSPKWISRLANALVVILGAAAVFSMTIPERIMSAEDKNFLGGTFTFLVSMVTVFKIITGKDNDRRDN